MLVERIFIDNPLRNFHYLVACPETGLALAIDPLETDAVLQVATDRGWRIEAVVCTHHHWDHAGGRDAMRQATGARIYAHRNAPLDGIDLGLSGGDRIRVGGIELQVLDTPGHTMSHVCLVGGGRIFAGDTLFVAGCGNCHHGGEPQALWKTFCEVLWELPDHLRIEPGHDYAANNLRFSLDREPSNEAAGRSLSRAELGAETGDFFRSTIGAERMHNPFFRTRSAEVRAGLGLDADIPDREVFLALREKRNHW